MTWRRWLAIVLVLACFAAPAMGQQRGTTYTPPVTQSKFELSGLYGYQWGGTVRGYDGDYVIASSGAWGIVADITIRPGAQIELSYSRQDADLMWKSKGIEEKLFDVGVEYWQIGGLAEFKRQGNVRFFGLMTLGATHFDPKGSQYADDWRFSTVFGVGAKVFFSEKVGLRLQATMPVTWLWSTGYCDWFYGCGVTGQGVVQGNLSAGLTFAF